MHISEFQKECFKIACKKGWWDEPNRSIGDIFSNFHAEISEAWEEYRNGHSFTEIYYNKENPKKPEGIPIELADEMIRIADFAEAKGINLTLAIMKKMMYNRTRPYRHGGKKA
jgi:NTP pyrophosphatase (non-canonical NTP hydrolase)